MAKKKMGVVTQEVKGKERVVFFNRFFQSTQAIKSVAMREMRTINRRYGKGTAYTRKTGKNGDWYSVFIRRK